MHYLHGIDGAQTNASFAFTAKNKTIPDVRVATWSAFPSIPSVRGKNLRINLRLPERQKLNLMLAANCRYMKELPNTVEILAREGLIDAESLRARAEEALGGYVGDVESVQTSIELACKLVEALRRASSKLIAR